MINGKKSQCSFKYFEQCIKGVYSFCIFCNLIVCLFGVLEPVFSNFVYAFRLAKCIVEMKIKMLKLILPSFSNFHFFLLSLLLNTYGLFCQSSLGNHLLEENEILCTPSRRQVYRVNGSEDTNPSFFQIYNFSF